MDPNAALERLRELIAINVRAETDSFKSELADDICEVLEGLDQWLSRGGFLPKAWNRCSAIPFPLSES
jgi:hypothetical protein